MKLLVLLLLAIGVASANLRLEQSADEFLTAFASDVPNDDAEVKKSVVDSLREALKEVMRKIKERVNVKHEQANDLLQQAGEIVERLRSIRVNVTDKTLDLIEQTRGKVHDLLTKLVNRIGNRTREKRDLKEALLLAELEYESILKRVAEKLNEKLTKSQLVEYLENLLAKEVKHEVKERLMHAVERKTVEEIKSILMGLLARELQSDQNEEISEDEKSTLRQFIEKLIEHGKSKYQQAFDWLTITWKQGLEGALEKHKVFKEIAQETIKDIQQLHKETIRELIEILRPHKEEMGKLWGELLTKAKIALTKHD